MSLEPLTHEEALNEIRRLQALLEGKSSYVDCICPGCPRRVPEAWVSGMCQPCCDEDCEHTDGAKAVKMERDEALVERDEVISRLLRLRETGTAEERRLWAEDDNFRAALTNPPTFEAFWREREAAGYRYGHDALEQVRFGWELAIAALRARAHARLPCGHADRTVCSAAMCDGKPAAEASG